MVARVQRLVIHDLCPAKREASTRPQRLGPSTFPDTSTLEPTVPPPNPTVACATKGVVMRELMGVVVAGIIGLTASVS